MPVSPFLNAGIQSASHVAAVHCVQSCRCRSKASVDSQTPEWEKCDPVHFDVGMVVGTRQADLNISEVVLYLQGSSHTTVSTETRSLFTTVVNKKKHLG